MILLTQSFRIAIINIITKEHIRPFVLENKGTNHNFMVINTAMLPVSENKLDMSMFFCSHN